jgi:hypothetical protein
LDTLKIIARFYNYDRPLQGFDVNTILKSSNYFTIIFLLISSVCYSQKQDHILLFGNQRYPQSTIDHLWDSFQYNFNKEPMELEYADREWDFSGTNTSICDEDGHLY